MGRPSIDFFSHMIRRTSESEVCAAGRFSRHAFSSRASLDITLPKLPLCDVLMQPARNFAPHLPESDMMYSFDCLWIRLQSAIGVLILRSVFISVDLYYGWAVN